jgi:hypothetical protein
MRFEEMKSVTERALKRLVKGKTLSAKQITRMGLTNPYNPIHQLRGRGYQIASTRKKDNTVRYALVG